MSPLVLTVNAVSRGVVSSTTVAAAVVSACRELVMLGLGTL